ncbi:unnamed protein product [Chrysodeixis includens]|uniref:Uncharacterized protein n=1 Tax=Chrysodeixis includens TaxID=689277 RepID=A0A9P0G0V2_CHRIL|nr:unnamed protein product [Chrysodeixis includens]
MAAGGAPVRQLRRGPAPIASFDHDVSDEVRPPSSPETKQSFRLPEIREDPACSSALAPPEQRARSHSTPAAGLHTPAAPRIDISRASSSSHHDSRDSSPELALFAGTGSDDTRGRLELGFREDGALELRSSTEELAFLEGAPGEPRPAAAPAPSSRRHSRKDSQGSEAALLAVSGRTSRLSSVGSQCSAHSALSAFSHQSRVSVGRLSVVSGISRSPSPHRMLLETSFCGPKPIETDPEICAAAVEERLLEIAKMGATSPSGSTLPPVDARDRREVRTEATVERAVTRVPPSSPMPVLATSPPAAVTTPSPAPATTPTPKPVPIVTSPITTNPVLDDDKLQKETQNRARAQERRARPRVRREPSEPEVYKSANRSKDVIRIKLKPDDDYEEEDDSSLRAATTDVTAETAAKPASLELAGRGGSRAVRPTELVGREAAPASPGSRRLPRDSRTPSPAAVSVSRKSSFCSLFKSRETIASPDSPSDALRRKRSLTEGRSRSKSRDRSATPNSAGKIRGSVLSLFRTPRKSATSPSANSRDGSPVVQPQRQMIAPSQPAERGRKGDKLKYYEDTKDGIIHIPLRTPPDERPGSSGTRRDPDASKTTAEVTTHREPLRPASAPIQSRPTTDREIVTGATQKPTQRTVLPDGSIIIPLRSPTEHEPNHRIPSPPPAELASSTEITGTIEVQSATVNQSDTPVVAPTPCLDDTECGIAPAADVESVELVQPTDEVRRRRKERLVFTTHVGSREQVFSTQFSITKTPSVTSEISGSFPSFVDNDDNMRTTSIRDVAPAVDTPQAESGSQHSAAPSAGGTRSQPSPASPQEPARDSSESEPSSESAPPIAGDEVEKRGLVVQQSFEEELPYVPTTLPQERSVALPMVPVRERGGVLVSGVSRPRGSRASPAPRPAQPRPRRAPAPCPPRPRTSCASACLDALAPPPRPPNAQKNRGRAAEVRVSTPVLKRNGSTSRRSRKDASSRSASRRCRRRRRARRPWCSATWSPSTAAASATRTRATTTSCRCCRTTCRPYASAHHRWRARRRAAWLVPGARGARRRARGPSPPTWTCTTRAPRIRAHTDRQPNLGSSQHTLQL